MQKSGVLSCLYYNFMLYYVSGPFDKINFVVHFYRNLLLEKSPIQIKEIGNEF